MLPPILKIRLLSIPLLNSLSQLYYITENRVCYFVTCSFDEDLMAFLQVFLQPFLHSLACFLEQQIFVFSVHLLCSWANVVPIHAIHSTAPIINFFISNSINALMQHMVCYEL